MFSGAPANAAVPETSSQVQASPVTEDFHVYHALHAGPRSYTVISGDTLSGIAQAQCGNPSDWTGIYEGNKAEIGTDPDRIFPGQRYALDCSAPALQAYHTIATDRESTAGTAAVYHQQASGSYGSVNPASYTGFQQCVIARESGGNSQVMNSSGHYGLYQFSYSTWVAYGGSGADFGHASVAEQNRVFATAMSQPGGAGNWAPYDGC